MQKILIKNKRAYFDYEVLEPFIAGIVLFGHEVKSLKTGGGHFTGSYITVRGGELFLEHFHIPQYARAVLDHYEPDRSRKLLVNRKEIIKISGALSTTGVTVVPLECGIQNGKIKISFALVRGKKTYDKRESLKKKDATRRIQGALKQY